MDILEFNKEIVRKFNKEVIEQGNFDAFQDLMDGDFVNRTAPEKANKADSMWHTFQNILRPAFPDLAVLIHDQIAEGDKVTTRKTIVGTHDGPLFDIAPTHRKIEIDVIDIVRLRDGKYLEHWGLNTLQTVLAELKK